jgi:lipoprotein-anchoring transpeptidase ErfK/SrfK
MIAMCHRRQFGTFFMRCVGVICLAIACAGCASSNNTYGSGWQDSNVSTPGNYSGEPEGEAFPPLMEGGPRPIIKPVAPARVYFVNTERPGTILIDTARRKLYYTLAATEAYEYPISVGRDGFTWTGTETINRIAEWPDWYPPKEMLQRDSRLPVKMSGGLRNPLGAVALFLGNSLYRIHGTNDAKTIGLAASSGCFRMLNEHALHLASLATVGTAVKVLPHLSAPEATAEALPWANTEDRAPKIKSGI